MICGPDCVNLQGETGTEVQGPEAQPVSQVRAAAGILPEIGSASGSWLRGAKSPAWSSPAGKGNSGGRRKKMGMTDPLADLITRLRNANKAKHEKVDVPASNLKVHVARILKDEGYVKNYKVIKDGKQGVLRIYLKFEGETKKQVIAGLRTLSKPGRRRYVGQDRIPQVLRGLGVSVLSTSKGILTDKEARKLNVGGELLFSVW
jgi:small subunit ribosomal protein S8